ncbi:MAG: phenylalanine--tRNA ligase subunit alpha, partial [Deltaproteobacteria bacterium]
MIQKLDDLHKEFQGQIAGLTNQADVLNLKADYLGKKGKVSEILKSLKDASAEERKELGPKANTIKDSMQEMVQDKLTSIELEEINQKLAQDKIDITYTNSVKETGIHHGGVHPRTLIQQEIEDIFLSMGFDILDGPHIEDEFHNFEALNIPGDHPARDMQDTFWFDDPESPEGRKHLLRTHTSTIQVRGMMSRLS